MRGASIKARSARGVAALSVGTVVERGLRLIRNMILTRILAPDEFGLMAIINVVAMALEAFMEVGVKQSVIQNKQGADADYMNVAWWMQAIRGLCLYGIAILLTPWISSFYGKPELLKLLRFAFIAVALRGFISPRAFVLEKEYKFGRVVFLTQGSAILGTVIALAAALVVRSVWALVFGFVAESFLLCVLSYVFAPFLPKFEINRKCLAELMRFARGMFGLAILTVVARESDILVLGRIVTETQL
ncbi:MAG: oligosaccharide flippase family protein, partial [Planctomycetota bacterium]|nr:oligosaccharide flippase family protein [Planctomycetota bacterium]